MFFKFKHKTTFFFSEIYYISSSFSQRGATLLASWAGFLHYFQGSQNWSTSGICHLGNAGTQLFSAQEIFLLTFRILFYTGHLAQFGCHLAYVEHSSHFGSYHIPVGIISLRFSFSDGVFRWCGISFSFFSKKFLARPFLISALSRNSF